MATVLQKLLIEVMTQSAHARDSVVVVDQPVGRMGDCWQILTVGPCDLAFQVSTNGEPAIGHVWDPSEATFSAADLSKEVLEPFDWLQCGFFEAHLDLVDGVGFAGFTAQGFDGVGEQFENGFEALTGAALASRQVNDQRACPRDSHGAREGGKMCALAA